MAYSLIISFAIYFFWQVKSVDFCVEADKNCFRDWVSALGGWAALAAAIPTVLYLSRQVRNDSRFNAVAVKMQVQPEMDRAVWTTALCRMLLEQISNEIEAIKSLDTSAPVKAGQRLLASFKNIRETMERDDLNLAAADYRVLARPYMAIKDIDKIQSMFEEMSATDATIVAEFTSRIDVTYRSAQLFLTELERATTKRMEFSRQILKSHSIDDY